MAWATDVGSGLIVAIISALAGFALQRHLTNRRYGHMRTILPDDHHIRLVVPYVENSDWSALDPEVARNPVEKTHFVPIGDFCAAVHLIARSFQLDHKSKLEIAPGSTGGDGSLTIALGGPYVNEFTKRQLQRHVPDLDYRVEGQFRVGSLILSPTRIAGQLTEDYGFLLLVTQANGSRVLCAFGMHNQGTEIAAKVLSNLDRHSEGSKLIRGGNDVFLIAQGQVTGVETSDERTVVTRVLASKRTP